MGDYSHLDQVWIGAEDSYKEQELADLVYAEDGSFLVKMLDKFPIDMVFEAEPYSVVVIIAGCIP